MFNLSQCWRNCETFGAALDENFHKRTHDWFIHYSLISRYYNNRMVFLWECSKMGLNPAFFHSPCIAWQMNEEI